jgi:hypothetical protein
MLLVLLVELDILTVVLDGVLEQVLLDGAIHME